MRAEEKRQEGRGKTKRKSKRKGRRGRFTTADKVAQAERAVDVFPDGVDKNQCQWSARRGRCGAGKQPGRADRL